MKNQNDEKLSKQESERQANPPPSDEHAEHERKSRGKMLIHDRKLIEIQPARNHWLAVAYWRPWGDRFFVIEVYPLVRFHLNGILVWDMVPRSIEYEDVERVPVIIKEGKEQEWLEPADCTVLCSQAGVTIDLDRMGREAERQIRSRLRALLAEEENRAEEEKPQEKVERAADSDDSDDRDFMEELNQA